MDQNGVVCKTYFRMLADTDKIGRLLTAIANHCGNVDIMLPALHVDAFLRRQDIYGAHYVGFRVRCSGRAEAEIVRRIKNDQTTLIRLDKSDLSPKMIWFDNPGDSTLAYKELELQVGFMAVYLYDVICATTYIELLTALCQLTYDKAFTVTMIS